MSQNSSPPTDPIEVEHNTAMFDRHAMALADAMPQIVWTAKPDGALDYYNQRWIDYTGMTVEQTLAWGWAPVLHPDDLQRCVDVWTTAYTSGAPYEIEYRFKRASDNTYRWHLGRAIPVLDLEGNIVKWFGTCTDIDDQKRAVLDVETQVGIRTAQLADANTKLCLEMAQKERLSKVQLRDSLRLNEIITTQCQLAEAKLDLEQFLQLVVYRLDSLTGAAGSVVEVVDGEDMVYRAGSGVTRAHVGLRLKRDSSISGLCVHTREVLYCVDSELDERVDRAACRRIGVRSMVVAPLFYEGKAIGVLKTMSSNPNAFSRADMQTLQLMAGLTGSAIAHQSAFSAKETILAELNVALLEIQTNERRTRTIIESAHDAFVAIGSDGRIRSWNHQAEVTFGWPRDEALGQKIERLIIPPRYENVHQFGMQRFLETGISNLLNKRVELIGLRKNGEEFPVELTINAIQSAGQTEYFAFLHDIADRKRTEEHMREMAQIDQLTGLPNRRLFFDRIVNAMGRAQRDNKLMALIYFDIDHFKQINDTLGHAAGDLVLREVAVRLTENVRGTDTVARLGGDEFVIIIENLQKPADAEEIVANIIIHLGHAFLIDNESLVVSASMGGAYYAGGNLTHTELVALADEAMYKAKQGGRNQARWAQSSVIKPDIV